MRKVKITLTDGTQIEKTEEEFMCADLTGLCNGRMIIKTDFFEESDL